MSLEPERKRFAAAVAAIDAANAEDPRTTATAQGAEPYELVYGRRMSTMLALVYPEASEALRLAARAQHIRRWELPRASFPEGKAGYHRWRNTQKQRHAELAGAILAGCGYGAEDIARVGQLIRKENLATDAEVQKLEDVICLVFLEYYLGDFAGRQGEAQLIDILRKTCAKMSDRGRALAMQLPLETHHLKLLSTAAGAD